MTTLFGVTVEKSTGTRFPGRQDRQLTPDQRVISSALANVSGQSGMNLQPDPTLGAPFSSFPDERLTVAQMGPGEPAENFPLGGEPRQWKYRVGWNFPTTPDTDRGIDGALLRTLADSSWLVRRCIEIRKHELTALAWDIVPRGPDRRHMARMHEPLIRSLRQFMRYPEGYFSFVTPDEAFGDRGVHERDSWVRRGLVDWADWLNAVLEDVFVGDWLSIWPQRTLGNDMLGLRRVDGQHIKALLDLDGRVPPPPMPAWQQYLYGVPRASWAADEFYYLPRDVRNMTPYGLSLVQQALIAVNLALRFDQWNTAAYTEGRIPMGLLEAPQGWTADQIHEVADFLNGAASSLAARQMVYPVPAGTKWQALKPFIFDEKYALYVIEMICACMDVQPQEMGFAPARAGMGGAGFAETQDVIRRRKSLMPTARWVEGKITRMINEQWRDLGGGDLEFRFTDLVHDEAKARFDAYAVAIRSGQRSLDELLEAEGQAPAGVGRIMETGQGLLFLDQGMALTANGMVPLRLPEAGEPAIIGPGTTGRDMTKAAEPDPFRAAWSGFWRDKVERARAQDPDRPEVVAAILALTRDEQTQLGQILHRDLRAPAYGAARRHLQDAAGLKLDPTGTRSDDLRLGTASQTHAVRIAQTYGTDLAGEFDRQVAGTQDWPDQRARAHRILDLLGAWVLQRAAWKGQEVAVTEQTDAEAQAARDFGTEYPAIFQEYRWRAILDDRTCEVCAGLDGQLIGANGPRPPAHPGCRCHLEPAATGPAGAP